VIDADRRDADPLALLVRAYDRAIRTCEAFDAIGAHQAIAVLREALDLSSSASRSFDAIYAWCDECVDTGDFMGAAQSLRTLREAWRRAGVTPAPTALTPSSGSRWVC
jgi:hypothetical protein